LVTARTPQGAQGDGTNSIDINSNITQIASVSVNTDLAALGTGQAERGSEYHDCDYNEYRGREWLYEGFCLRFHILDDRHHTYF
jgi:hypothetical protein